MERDVINPQFLRALSRPKNWPSFKQTMYQQMKVNIIILWLEAQIQKKFAPEKPRNQIINFNVDCLVLI